ncbi:probable (S)-N-methylcoclaurine 3'-hydroxylase isozyme 2 [Magnolia sinica]|uniref:probable (S)-N-methylcoclaurine 3'-hydroxylase isozyme 2 n=1 Tax=Magnolia sinica TaxID=86752 RepID=UPI00265818A1|nr:probable (S)-N-methylcoclaurine 3'-hydroxylase isozyme 2 [Magnolia sinica]
MEFLSIALLFSFICIAYFLLRDPRQKGLPPGPRPWPILGNLLQLGDMPHSHLAKLAQSYGHLFTLKLGVQTVVVASSPAAAAEILKTHDRVFSGRYVFHNFRIENHVEYSMVWSECNDYWKMLRRICRTELFSPKMIEMQAHLRENKVSDMVGHLGRKEGEVVKIAEIVFGTLFNIFGNLIYSKDVFDLSDPSGGEIKGQIWRLMELGNSTNPADYFPILGEFDLFRQRRAVADCLHQIYDVWNAILRERREKKEADSNHDFTNVLLKANLNDHQINALLMEMFGAGTETSASTIEWAMAELIKNPDIMSKVRSELDRVVGPKMVKESDLPSLPYLQACVKETLRLHPPTPLLLPHRALEKCQLFDYTIPKDCQLMVNAWAIGRDPKTWNDPMTFVPERFLNSTVDYKGNDFELIPFSAGRRICPGVPLASQFIPLIVASLVQNFVWGLPNGMRPSELVMDEKFGLTLQKEPPLLVVPKARV